MVRRSVAGGWWEDIGRRVNAAISEGGWWGGWREGTRKGKVNARKQVYSRSGRSEGTKGEGPLYLRHKIYNFGFIPYCLILYVP